MSYFARLALTLNVGPQVPHTPHLTLKCSWCLHRVWNSEAPERSQQLSPHPLPFAPPLVWPPRLGSLELLAPLCACWHHCQCCWVPQASQFHCISATPPDSCKTVLPWRALVHGCHFLLSYSSAQLLTLSGPQKNATRRPHVGSAEVAMAELFRFHTQFRSSIFQHGD